MLAGRLPYDLPDTESSLHAVFMAVIRGMDRGLPDVRQFVPGLLPQLGGLTMRMLSRDPGDRPADGSELARLLATVSTVGNQAGMPRAGTVSATEDVTRLGIDLAGMRSGGAAKAAPARPHPAQNADRSLLGIKVDMPAPALKPSSPSASRSTPAVYPHRYVPDFPQVDDPEFWHRRAVASRRKMWWGSGITVAVGMAAVVFVLVSGQDTDDGQKIDEVVASPAPTVIEIEPPNTGLPEQETGKINKSDLGLAKLLDSKLSKDGVISCALSDDPDCFEKRMAQQMVGTGSELVVGNGSSNISIKGSEGGSGGYGRIHGLGAVDTGGDMGILAGLRKKGAKRAGNLKLGGIGTAGYCKKPNIEAVVKQRAGAIRACYEAQLQLEKGLAGKLAVRWTINTAGEVDAAMITSSTLGNSKVESCVMTIIRRMTFAKPEGGICVVQWPFVFSPG